MAYVPISDRLTYAVNNYINQMRNTEVANTLPAAITWPDLKITEDDQLFNAVWAPAPELRGKLPDKWLADYGALWVIVRLVSEKGETLAEEENEYKPYGPLRLPVAVGSAAYRSYAKIVAPKDDTRFDTVRAQLKARHEIFSRWEGVNKQVIEYLRSAKSLNEAVKLFPDITNFIPKEFLSKLNEKKVAAAKEVSGAMKKLGELDLSALQAAPVIARIAGHKDGHDQ